jgi:ELWxxDGT repeat protein
MRQFGWAASIALMVMGVGFAFGGEPRMVADIDPRVLSDFGLGPREITGGPNRVFFVGQRLDLGAEVWSTDPITEETSLCADLRPGWLGSDPWTLTAVDDAVLFSGNDGTHWGEPFFADEHGVRIVADLVPGLGSSVPRAFTVTQDLVFFRATNAEGVQRLWTTDISGSSAQTVTDIVSPASYEDVLGVNGDVVFFPGETTDHGTELWRSDGTPGGTWIVRDIAPDALSSVPGGFVVIDEVLYFSADDAGATGRELWRSDGTEAGTWVVKDINPGPEGSNPRLPCRLVLAAVLHCGQRIIRRRHLGFGRNRSGNNARRRSAGGFGWKPDQRVGGPRLRCRVRAGRCCGRRRALVFRRVGRWDSDDQGRPSRTRMDPTPATSSASTGPCSSARTTVPLGFELWVSDTTEPGTTVVKDIAAGADQRLALGARDCGRRTLVLRLDAGGRARTLAFGRHIFGDQTGVRLRASRWVVCG